MSRPDSFFRGAELPRLLVLLVIMGGGLAFLWQQLYSNNQGILADVPVTAPQPPIVPDRAPEFETVTDKTRISLRDMSAYEMLLKRSEGQSPASLAEVSRHDVLSVQLWERPQHYRGVPIHILGTALRVMTYDSKYAKSGRLYEAWVVTSDSQRNPYVCVFEDAPKGFPIGDQLSERIIFNGYFLKLMRYEAGDFPRASPLLIGRIGWTPGASQNPGGSKPPYMWLAVGVGVMFVISFFRWFAALRRSFAKLSGRPSSFIDRPTEFISPEDFSSWIDKVADEEGESEPHDPSR